MNELSLLETVISLEGQRQMQMNNLLSVLKLFFCTNSRCWHNHLEQESILLEEDVGTDPNEMQICGDACGYCRDSMKDYILPVSRTGLVSFILYSFVHNPCSRTTPVELADKLFTFPEVGKVVYNRRVSSPPSRHYTHATILQLIASKILKLQVVFEEDKPIAVLTMNVIDEIGTLAFTKDEFWMLMHLK